MSAGRPRPMEAALNELADSPTRAHAKMEKPSLSSGERPNA
jgi:hypothetical protein